MGYRGTIATIRTASWIAALWLMLGTATPLHAEGEAVDGFPNWAERVIVAWTNRARSDPQAELQACEGNCGDAACYLPIAPLPLDLASNRASRFHSDEMLQQGYFDHTSQCSVVANIDQLYPNSCNGAASCACNGGNLGCPCTSASQRMALFGAAFTAENIATTGDPNLAFQLWLYESFPSSTCAFTIGPPTNGHRYILLKSVGVIGAGVSSTRATVSISSASRPVPRIPSGSHYPRQAESVQAWVNWYDSSGPSVHMINVGGTCSSMTLARGTAQNGAWTATIDGVASGCHRYVFAFKDANGLVVQYPSSGSLGIGPGGSCPDWDASAPPLCPGFELIFADGFEQ